MRSKKKYLPLDDIKEINAAYLDEIETVRRRMVGITGKEDKEMLAAFYNVLLEGYTAAIDLKLLEREVDYDIKVAELKARAEELKPWRRCWLWRLLFLPLTNRAQDIIEKRAELDADLLHTSEENAIDNDRRRLPPKSEKLTKDEIRRRAKETLKATIEAADRAPVSEAFDEPANANPQPEPDERENAAAQAQTEPKQEAQAQAPQRSSAAFASGRRPRPPRSCRRPPTPGQ